MRWFRFAGLIFLATLLQASLVNIISITNIKPDLLLILLVFFAIYSNISDAIITSFVIGFAADIIGPAMGPQIISFGLFGTALAYLRRVIAIHTIPHQSLTILITGILVGALAILLTLLKAEPLAQSTFAVLLGIPIYSSLVGPFLFLPSAWWMRIKTHRIRRH